MQYQAAADYKKRHCDFHQQKAVEKPLVGVYRHGIYPLADFIQAFPEGEVSSEDLNPKNWLRVYEDAWINTELMSGDLIHWACPLNGFPWMESIAGCPVYASKGSQSIWAERPEGFQLGDKIVLDRSNPWFEKLLENTEAVARLSKGRFPVAPGIMRGISDLMLILLGHNDFFLHLKDHPKALREMAENLADFWIEVVKAQYETIPAFDGGYANAGLWMPGLCPVYQEDAAALISAEDFDQIIQPEACQVLAAFEYPIMHFHSVGVHLIPLMIGCNPNLTIEVNIDPAGMPVETLLPAFDRIQEAAPLMIFGTAEEIQTCLEALPTAGAAYLILESSLEESDAR